MGVPITIVSGFLGSGKTTLINQVLESTKIPKEEILIIENELGKTGVDHELLLQTNEQVVQLNNGCMCCSLRGDLIAALMAIKKNTKDWVAPVSKIIIETTGIADPQPIIQTILTVPHLRNVYFIDSILTVVDVCNFSRYSKESVYMKQISLADRIFLSLKQDSNEEEGTYLLKQIKQVNVLADHRFFSKSKPIHDSDFFCLGKFQASLDRDENVSFDSNQSARQCEHPHTEHGFQSFVLTTEVKLNKIVLVRWLDWLIDTNQDRLYRFKGLVMFENHKLAVALQGVNQQVSFDLTAIRSATSKIVLIGKELEFKKIQMSFNELCLAHR